MKNIKIFIDSVFENSNELQVGYKDELMNNYDEEIEDLCKTGLNEDQAEQVIMKRFGSVYEYREALGISHIQNKIRFRISLYLLVFHLLLNIFSLFYFISFYIPRISFSYPFSFIDIEMYVIVLYAIVSSSIQLVFFTIYKSHTVLDSLKKVNILYLIISLLTLPFGLIGLILIFVIKDKSIITYLQSKTPILLANPIKMKRLCKSIMFLLLIMISFYATISLLRQDKVNDHYELIEHTYSDSNRGINLYGKIFVRELNDDELEFQLDSTLSIHYTNFDTLETIYFRVIFDNQEYDFEENEIKRSANQHLVSSFIVNSYDWKNDLTIAYDICSDASCSIILESFEFSLLNVTLTEVIDKDSVWIWNN